MSVRIVAATAALVVAGTTAGAASSVAASPDAAPKPTVTVVAKPYLSPLSVAQAPDGTRWWTDDFAAQLWKQAPGGQPVLAYQGDPKAGVESVSVDGGVLRFTTGAEDNSAGRLMTLDPAGNAVQLADLYAHEKTSNADRKITYGLLKTPKRCQDLLSPASTLFTYKGTVESHPYATASANGITYVADAGANAIFAVSATGVVSTVAVIKPAKVKVTRKVQLAADLPPCMLGKKIALESVPTDIEVGPGGALYVTNLSGGPEDGSLGANGRISRIDPATGTVTTLSKGYAGLTGIAVSPAGDLYAADLFTGAILTIPAGKNKPTTYVEAKFPAAVEWTPTGLLATIKALPGKKPKGQVVTITP